VEARCERPEASEASQQVEKSGYRSAFWHLVRMRLFHRDLGHGRTPADGDPARLLGSSRNWQRGPGAISADAYHVYALDLRNHAKLAAFRRLTYAAAGRVARMVGHARSDQSDSCTPQHGGTGGHAARVRHRNGSERLIVVDTAPRGYRSPGVGGTVRGDGWTWLDRLRSRADAEQRLRRERCPLGREGNF